MSPDGGGKGGRSFSRVVNDEGFDRMLDVFQRDEAQGREGKIQLASHMVVHRARDADAAGWTDPL